jgi:hypothetical protein
MQHRQIISNDTNILSLKILENKNQIGDWWGM